MVRLAYDLHIHSCLSPCGNDDMTPYNIVAMAALKGLDVIAVTDHNSCKNCPAVLSAAKEYGILAISGMEITTSEEVHAVCLFASLENAMKFDAYVYEHLMPVKNRVDIFGKQEIYDCSDNICGQVENLLINSTDISFDALCELAGAYGGIMFPAHIDKNSNSLISNLGFVPENSAFAAAELANSSGLPELTKRNPYLKQCRILYNSDAHYLEHINEAQHMVETDHLIDVQHKSVDAVLAALGKRTEGGSL